MMTLTLMRRCTRCIPRGPVLRGQKVLTQVEGLFSQEGDVLVIKKSTSSKKRPVKPDEPEHLPEGNFGEMRVELWREFRFHDPYRFKNRTYTGEDKMFWTEG
jgi:hypothetical protein